MAVYKVIQDVEAEDKVLGPLSLKQLIYAGISVAIIFVAFRLVTAVGSIFVAIPFLPFVFAFGALAAPLSRDQTTEIWIAAQIRFYTKPRIRIWDQSGLKELVHITVPKKEEKFYTDGLSQTQVHSRLKALANTLDSRGWAVKNVDVNMASQMAYGAISTDRLIDPSTLPQAVVEADVRASDDIMDVNSNQTAQHFEQLMQQSSQEHKAEVIERMHSAAQQATIQATPTQAADPYTAQNDNDDNETTDDASEPQDYWFMHQPTPTGKAEPGQAMFEHTVVTPGALDKDNQPVMHSDAEPSPEEQAIIDRAKALNKEAKAQNPHHKVILTQKQQEELAQQQLAKEQEQRKKEAEHKTRLTKTDTIELANANLKVSTIAGLAHHKTEDKHDPNEVVVKLR